MNYVREGLLRGPRCEAPGVTDDLGVRCGGAIVSIEARNRLYHKFTPSGRD